MQNFDPRRLKILLIDDEPFIRTTLRQILVQVGIAPANVYESGSVKAGISQTLRIRPDLVLCDIHMPDEDGFAYLMALHKSPVTSVSSIPVVMLTSDSTEEAVLVAKQLKVEGYLVKPVSISSVKRSVERALKITLGG